MDLLQIVNVMLVISIMEVIVNNVLINVPNVPVQKIIVLSVTIVTEEPPLVVIV